MRETGEMLQGYIEEVEVRRYRLVAACKNAIGRDASHLRQPIDLYGYVPVTSTPATPSI